MFIVLARIFVVLCFCSIVAASAQEDDVLDFLPAILASQSNNPSAANLCDGFRVNDKTNRPMGALGKPLPLESYTDPKFGSSITRITNSNALSSSVARTMYSTIQAWNADESKLILWHRGDGHYLYNGKTYALGER